MSMEEWPLFKGAAELLNEIRELCVDTTEHAARAQITSAVWFSQML